jgi:hypothetical protein
MLWKVIERTCIVFGAVLTGVCAYYAAATYYGWNDPKMTSVAVNHATIPIWLYVAGSIGVMLIVTGWGMIIERRLRPVFAVAPQIEVPAVALPPAPPLPDNRVWLTSYKIFDLADPELTKDAVIAEEEVQKVMEDIEKIREQRQKFLKRINGLEQFDDTATSSLTGWQEALSIANSRSAALHEARERSRAKALEDIYEKLRSGKLIAKGFLHPVRRTAIEREIPASQWRIIRFNGDYTRAQGQSIEYSGIAVAKGLASSTD